MSDEHDPRWMGCSGNRMMHHPEPGPSRGARPALHRAPTRPARSAFRRARPSRPASTSIRSATGTTPIPTTGRSRAGTTCCATGATRGLDRQAAFPLDRRRPRLHRVDRADERVRRHRRPVRPVREDMPARADGQQARRPRRPGRVRIHVVRPRASPPARRPGCARRRRGRRQALGAVRVLRLPAFPAHRAAASSSTGTRSTSIPCEEMSTAGDVETSYSCATRTTASATTSTSADEAEVSRAPRWLLRTDQLLDENVGKCCEPWRTRV